MSTDLFDFWADVPGDAHVHPKDAKVLDCADHNFKLGCLPISFSGPMRTAPVVFLFLSPGLHEFDLRHATMKEGQAYYRSQRSGLASLPTEAEHPPAWAWWRRTVSQMG